MCLQTELSTELYEAKNLVFNLLNRTLGNGATENAERENDGPSKSQGVKMRHEIAGHKKADLSVRKCRT